MSRHLSVAGLIALALVPCAALAQEELPDELPGSHDHPLVKRYPGSVITEQEQTDSDTLQFPTGEAQVKSVEGRYFHAQYYFPSKASCADVLRKLEAGFKSAGLAVRSGEKRPAELASVGDRWVSAEGRLKGKGPTVYIVQTCNDDPSYHAGDLFLIESLAEPAAPADKSASPVQSTPRRPRGAPAKP